MRSITIATTASLLLTFFVAVSRAAVCNEDNCYRNLQHNCNAASSFCATLTTASVTSTTTPSFVLSTCGISRLSSACSCVFPKTLAPTATALPCYAVPCPPGRQYVNLGGFDSQVYSDNDPPVPGWAIGTSGPNYQIYRAGGDCSDQKCFVQFGTNGRVTGSGFITQNLTNLCGGQTYNISGLIGTNPNDPYYNISSTISVFLGDTKVYGPEVPCSAALPCTIPYGSGIFKLRPFSTLAKAPYSAPNITIRVDYVDNGNQAWATWLDTVTVTGV